MVVIDKLVTANHHQHDEQHRLSYGSSGEEVDQKMSRGEGMNIISSKSTVERVLGCVHEVRGGC